MHGPDLFAGQVRVAGFGLRRAHPARLTAYPLLSPAARSAPAKGSPERH
jgi:hypothetical protein